VWLSGMAGVVHESPPNGPDSASANRYREGSEASNFTYEMRAELRDSRLRNRALSRRAGKFALFKNLLKEFASTAGVHRTAAA
jgi:hypothetical protein